MCGASSHHLGNPGDQVDHRDQVDHGDKMDKVEWMDCVDQDAEVIWRIKSTAVTGILPILQVWTVLLWRNCRYPHKDLEFFTSNKRIFYHLEQ